MMVIGDIVCFVCVMFIGLCCIVMFLKMVVKKFGFFLLCGCSFGFFYLLVEVV